MAAILAAEVDTTCDDAASYVSAAAELLDEVDRYVALLKIGLATRERPLSSAASPRSRAHSDAAS